ncbi:MAG: hypothetical protein ACKO1N_03870 [Erythrobacter sp.]
MVLTLAVTGGLAAMAQPAPKPSADLVDELEACRALPSESERLACYDAKVGALLGAVEAGDVRLVDREQVRKTRRQLFGLTVPEIDILKDDEKDKAAEEDSANRFETTIASGRQVGPATWRFTTVEGAVWEINSPRRTLAPINPGDTVVFKKASLGAYFIRINNGQMGVKGKRIQ